MTCLTFCEYSAVQTRVICNNSMQQGFLAVLTLGQQNRVSNATSLTRPIVIFVIHPS